MSIPEATALRAAAAPESTGYQDPAAFLITLVEDARERYLEYRAREKAALAMPGTPLEDLRLLDRLITSARVSYLRALHALRIHERANSLARDAERPALEQALDQALLDDAAARPSDPPEALLARILSRCDSALAADPALLFRSSRNTRAAPGLAPD